MSIETSQKYTGETKTILEFAGELFQNTLVKVKKTDVPEVDGKRILEAGTFISKDGKIVDGTTVTDDKTFGIVYKDKDFTNSNGTETVAVTIFGFIKESILPKAPSAAVKTALKMVQFL